MTPGAIVSIIAGPWAGRIGVVDAVTVEGLAVRLRGTLGGPVREVVVVQRSEVAAVAQRRAAA